MDAFYASVEIRERPELGERPVVVGGDPQQRGVVCAANYVARRYGIHSAMPTRTAARLCPDAVFLPPRMSRYAQVSQHIRAIFQRYTPIVEPLSLDEAFLDITDSALLHGSAQDIGRCIKAEIRAELGLIASVGVAPNKFLAKLASDLNKPDGFVVVQDDRIEAFLRPLSVSRLWGVGKVAGNRLRTLGIQTFGDLQGKPVTWAIQHFGKPGRHLWELARGIDARAVVPDRAAKSISHETTFATDIDDPEVLVMVLSSLNEQVSRRLRQTARVARSVVVKVRFSDFTTTTRTRRLSEPTHGTKAIWCTVQALFENAMATATLPVRLLGVGVNDLMKTRQQGDLFESVGGHRGDTLDHITDEIVARFGAAAVKRGSSR